MPLSQLIPSQTPEASGLHRASRSSVDVVAVHGFEEDLIEAWTDPHTRVLWLRDLLPSDVPIGRVLCYGYNASVESFCGHGSSDRIQQHAQTLIADLYADRCFEQCSSQPIIFICHGLGGLLVKKALAYSSTRTSKDVQHLHSIYISTYAILFFGTPHHGADTAAWLTISAKKTLSARFRQHGESALLSAVSRDCEILRTITDQFEPLMKRYRIFFLWEELETKVGDRRCCLVDESSAAPIVDNTERAGIYADHFGMIRFSTNKSSSYRTVIEALKRYCQLAPDVVCRRWLQADNALASARTNEAMEMVGLEFDVDHKSLRCQQERRVSDQPRNKYFEIPQTVSSIFTGRESVAADIQDAFWSLDTEHNVTQQKRYIIYGMGGSGKTQFCSKFAQDNRQRFWGVFWIDATSTDTAQYSFSAIGKLGGMEPTQSAGKHWLATLEETWLLIINNADDPAIDVASLFPSGERGYILVTTQNQHMRIHGTVGSREFRGLEEGDALQLFLRAADTPTPWDEAVKALGRKIVDALGCLALALVQAGALIYQRVCDMRDYLEEYQTHWQNVRGRRASLSSITDDRTAVYATWNHSIRILEERRSQASRDALELLNIAAFFHFEKIRTDIFTRAMNNRARASQHDYDKTLKDRFLRALQDRLRPPLVLPGFLRGETAGNTSYRIGRALKELTSFSLVTYDSKNSIFSLHPLVYAWARDRLDKEQELWAQIAVNVLAESVLLPPEDQGKIHEEYRRDILIHLDRCLQTCPVQIMDFGSAFGGFKMPLALTVHYGWLFTFRDQVLMAAKFGYLFLERGRFEDAARLLEQVKDALIVSRGCKDPKTQKVMLALAHNYWGLGWLGKAIELQIKVIETQKMVSGTHHPETLSSMDQLGKSYWLNGQYKEALQLQTRTVDLMTLSLEQDAEATNSAMDNLGVTLGSWKRFVESRDIHEKVLNFRRRKLGPYELDTLTAMNNKAMALKDLGELDEAKCLMEIVVEQRKLKLGKEHPWTLWGICNLAKVNTELGLLKDAESLLVEGIAAGKRSLSDDHLGVLMGVGELARIYARQERWLEAITMAEDLIVQLKKSRGAGHPDTLFAMSRLTFAYVNENRLANAIRLCDEARAVSTERLPEEHPLVQRIVEQSKQLEARSHIIGKPSSKEPSDTLDGSTSQGGAKELASNEETRKQRLKYSQTF